ncbi:hypothetical protein AGDE_16031 [Angomonas deanei]|uniref:C3H1-type domain-containing protein n=1 Tax=Angomonas deanei TaxID=59799 RepID=A0A7G2C384_9TRYP|nr:hypothetical protein AGDE_16031 [Angomonas deanei]CAD2214156.1 hypothetical protein, conserved [Angomonas deanei]|eukprot:EPY17862.1 hypothetical protein AGDE_16031 [Angomonas deanei]
MKCPHIHVALPNSSSVQQNQTHIASLKAIQDCHYERLPASVQVYVYIPPNRRKTQSETTLFPGDSVLRTVGATQYEEVFTRNGCEVPQSATFQHCIHFIQNKMCRLGAECNFLHIIQEELLQSTTPEATPYPTEVEGPSSNHAALMAASDFLGRESPVYRAEGRTPVATPVPRRSSPTRIVVELPDTSQLPAAPPPQPSGRVSPTGRVSPSGRVSPKRNNPYQLSPMSEPLA